VPGTLFPAVLEPLLTEVASFNQRIAEYDRRIEQIEIRFTLNLFPPIDVGFQYASRKSLPQCGNDKPRRQTHMDWRICLFDLRSTLPSRSKWDAVREIAKCAPNVLQEKSEVAL
jgi:hypothetical protein